MTLTPSASLDASLNLPAYLVVFFGIPVAFPYKLFLLFEVSILYKYSFSNPLSLPACAALLIVPFEPLENYDIFPIDSISHSESSKNSSISFPNIFSKSASLLIFPILPWAFNFFAYASYFLRISSIYYYFN